MRALYNGHPYSVIDIIGAAALLQGDDTVQLIEVATNDPLLELDTTEWDERVALGYHEGNA